MKKSLITLLLPLIMVALIFTLCACGDKNGDEKNAPSNELDEVECEHKEWTLLNSLEVSCEHDGHKTLSCKSCMETKTIIIPRLEHEYVASWEWYNDNTSAVAHIKCKNCTAPAYTVNGVIKSARGGDVITAPTCQKYGEKAFRAEAYYKGETFYTEKREPISRRMCTYNYSEAEVIHYGDSCFDRVETIYKCKWCQRVVDSTNSYNHTTVTEKERYDLSEYGYCGGYVSYRACECGEKAFFEVCNSCKEEGLTRSSYFDEDGIEHVTQATACPDCGFTIMESWGDASSPCMETVYHKKSVGINDEISFEINVTDTPHSRSYKSFDLNGYCGCVGVWASDVVRVRQACACGKYKEEIILETTDKYMYHGATNGAIIRPTYIEMDISEFLPDGLVSFKDEKAYAFECGLCIFDGYIVVSTEVGDCIYKFVTVRYGDNIICETKGEVYIIVDDSPTDKYALFKSRYAIEEEKPVIESYLKSIMPDEEFEIPVTSAIPVIPDEPDEPDIPSTPSKPSDLTDEEKQTIIDYLNDRLNSETVDLTEEERQKYLEIIEQLEKELGENQQ